MTVVLTAPISETDYRAMPYALKLPADITGDAITTMLNQAWKEITTWCKQPLTRLAWNSKVNELVCLNIKCPLDHTKQRLENITNSRNRKQRNRRGEK